ncbi:DNA repair protein rhp26 [Ceratocystis pirilliformis]|uniref:DNA repair protein rhp26 n=1 Tax=Ceratocystis pirilliformis TaxID=259994 RepID=A0ABR3Z678_9PEZI
MSVPQNTAEAQAVSAAINGIVDVHQQDDLQRDVTSEAHAAIFEQDNKRDEERIANLKQKIVKIQANKTTLSAEFDKKSGNFVFRIQAVALRKKIDKCELDVAEALDEIEAFKDRIANRIEQQKTALAAKKLKASAPSQPGQTDTANGESLSRLAESAGPAGPVQQEGEYLEEYLVRTGKITPFDLQNGRDLQEFMEELGSTPDGRATKRHQELLQPGFESQSLKEVVGDTNTLATQEFSLRPRKRRRQLTDDNDDGDNVKDGDLDPKDQPTSKKRTVGTKAKAKSRTKNKTSRNSDSDSDYADNRDDESSTASDDMGGYDDTEQDSKASRAEKALPAKIDLSRIDDGNTAQYRRRLAGWVEKRSGLRESLGLPDPNPEMEEWYKPTPGKEDLKLIDGYSLPSEVGSFLFPFQKVGVEWLCQLHSRLEGGLLCDEMGLGKTVQIIATLVALHYSKKLEGPAIILAPSTLMAQWVQHFHTWWPPLRVSILHSTGSGMLDPEKEEQDTRDSLTPKKLEAARRIIDNVVDNGHVLITTYKGLQTYLDELAVVSWGYVALDEGHLIRNRNTEASKACKQLATYNRIVMSGTPIQNNLRELFSLFEFAYPGLLGTDTRSFSQHFEMPIRDGHHRNATNLAIMTAEKCARTLRETVKPYMLRRVKADVADSLPPKSEQVFFCKLTPQQEDIYVKFIESPHIKALFADGKTLQQKNAVFAAIDTLRKICNHPDLRWGKKHSKLGLDGVESSQVRGLRKYEHGGNREDDSDFGNPERSTKMQVLISLLRISKNFGHKTLVFSQSLPVLDIIEIYLRDEGYAYVRMDGTTNQIERQPMVDRFNQSKELEVFLLTPQTGGVGLNLTGANRVILFDPSWNPATDKQAVERAWRLGQKRPVEIYRLLTPGTIEEKIYRKQLYKQFMTDKIMTETEFHRSFDSNSMADMFTYKAEEKDRDLDIFEGAEAKFQKNGDSRHGEAKNTDGISKLNVGLQDAEPKAEKKKVATVGVLPTEEATVVSHLDQVKAIEEFQPDKTEAEQGMLEDLFTRSIDSAYNHEDIINAKQRVQANRRFLEEEAERLNRETKRFLQQQAARAHHDRHSAPSRSSSGPNMGGVKTRPTVLTKTSAAALAPRRNQPAIEMMWTLRSLKSLISGFLEEQDGQAHTADIANYFNSKYNDLPADLFRRALESVAKMHDAPAAARKKGTKLWKLKRKR